MERALQFSRLADSALGRVGGHLVTGHVDGVGLVSELRDRAGFRELDIACPPALLGLLVQKGSVAVDGVSLTVNGLLEKGFSVGLVQHTLEATTLSALKKGARVNLEADLIGKYVGSFMKAYRKENT